MQENKYDVVIIGGGLAGLTAALHLRKAGLHILVIEKQVYPHHKVCGEYVSNEVLPYLEYLGVSLQQVNAVAIDTFQLSTLKGKTLTTKLPLGGTGISRYAFDDLLYQKGLELGVSFVFETVDNVTFQKNGFIVDTSENTKVFSPFVIGSYGKRTQLDKRLQRNFIKKKSSWLAVKAHYNYDFPENMVALHNFKGGYGGLSKTENGLVNFCYLANYKTFSAYKNIENFNTHIVSENPFLHQFLKDASLVFEKPLSIAQVSFHQKNAIENHMLMCGDSAGLIHPLCGNGMAMAIHSAKIASELLLNFHNTKDYSREMLESDYSKIWNVTFKKRLYTGRQLQRLLLHHKLSNIAMSAVTRSPMLVNTLIKKTHGKSLTC